MLVSVGFGPHQLATNITLLKAQHVEDIFEGHDDKYKAVSMGSESISSSRSVLQYCEHLYNHTNMLDVS